MTYFETVHQAIEQTVFTDDNTGVSYLDPMYRETLRQSGIIATDYEDDDTPEIVPEDELVEILKLEVEKRNAKNNRLSAVAQWAWDVIDTQIAPAITDAENEMASDLVKYMQMKENEGKNVKPVINFSKRKDTE